MLLVRCLVPFLLLALAPVDESPFLLGVLRRDGIVFPFAAYDGKRWEAHWPQDLRYLDLPLTLDSVPTRWWGKPGLPAQFTAWRDGKAQGVLRPDRPVLVPAACSRRIAVSTDYRPTELPPPPIVRPYPKDGLVVSGDQRIETIASVPTGSAEWNAALLLLADPVDKAEQRAVESFTEWSHPVKRNERKKVPVEIEALYRAPMDKEGWTAYHVEALKRYAPGKQDEGCGLVTSAIGWIAIGPGRKQWTQLTARITYCDRKGVSYFLPLGLMRLRDRTYWIYQTSGYDHERFFVVRVADTVDVEAAYTAGNCS